MFRFKKKNKILHFSFGVKKNDQKKLFANWLMAWSLESLFEKLFPSSPKELELLCEDFDRLKTSDDNYEKELKEWLQKTFHRCVALDCLLEDLGKQIYEKRGPKIILYFRLKNRKTRKNSFKKLEVELKNPSQTPTNPLLKRKYGQDTSLYESLDQDEKNLDEAFKIRYDKVYS